jgi:hypothetical protein
MGTVFGKRYGEIKGFEVDMLVRTESRNLQYYKLSNLGNL